MTKRETWRHILADVAVVTVTPFVGHRLEDVDHVGLAGNLERLLHGGIRVLVAGGNTGEFAALSGAELVAVVRTHAEVAAGRAQVVAGVGYGLDRAARLGQAAIDAGADALMIHYPIHPYVGEAGLIRYYEALSDVFQGAPLILYVRGPQLTPDGIRRLAASHPIVGLKMGHADPSRFAKLREAAPDLAWVCGVAEGWAVPFWEAGAIGFTSGLANVTPERSLRIRDALRVGDRTLAETLVGQVRSFEALRALHSDANNVAVIKAAMDAVGLAGGRSRPPLSDLGETDRVELSRILKQLDLVP